MVAMTGATCGEAGFTEQEIYANQSVCAIRNSTKYDHMYIFYFLIGLREYTESFKLGGAQAGINVNDVRNLKICFPGIKEQLFIVEKLSGDLKKLKKTIELTLKKIELLKEYKQSLIYEAVTGKLEIN